MKKITQAFSSEQIAAFRLRRHHLAARKLTDPAAVCREIGGVQTQIDAAAYLGLWNRSKGLSRTAIESALLGEKTLVKSSFMRQTLHLIPADEFYLYITALRASRMAGALQVMARCGITPKEADHFTTIIMKTVDDLAAGKSATGVTRRALRDAVRPQVSKKIQAYMDKVWSIVRLPVAEGLLCYGEDQGSEAVWVRTDQWLPRQKRVTDHDAQQFLFRRYLSAYGPATLQDFSKWSGIGMKEAAHIRAAAEEIAEVVDDGKPAMLLAEDLKAIRAASTANHSVRLLPHFDSFILGHVDKSSLLDMRHYKKVYRNQAWISPVILVNGRIAGTWSHVLRGKKLAVEIAPFKKLSSAVIDAIEHEAAGLAVFLGASLSPDGITIRS